MQVSWDLIERIAKFGIVGGFCFVIDFSITYYLKEKSKVYKFVANASGFIVSVIINFECQD